MTIDAETVLRLSRDCRADYFIQGNAEIGREAGQTGHQKRGREHIRTPKKGGPRRPGFFPPIKADGRPFSRFGF
jgi:hypothetical protein